MKLIDKDAVVAEIERLMNNQDSALDYEAALEDVRNFIDTLEVKYLQEEPVSIDFEQELYKAFGQVKDFTLGMRIAKWFYDMGKNSQEPVGNVWHDAYEEPDIDKTFLLIAPNGNSSLCLWSGKELISHTLGGGHSVICKGDKWAYVKDLLNLSNIERNGKNWKEEPVSEELEKVAIQYSKSIESDYINAMFDEHNIYDAVIYGANWQKRQMMEDAVDGVVFSELEDGGKMVRSHYFESDKLKYLDEVKLIIIKNDEL